MMEILYRQKLPIRRYILKYIAPMESFFAFINFCTILNGTLDQLLKFFVQLLF